MDSLGRLQQRIVSPVLRRRSPSPERTNPRGWGIRRARGLTSRYHSAPLSANMNRSKPKPLMSTRRGQFSTSGSTAPGSSRAESPQKSFTEYLSDVIIPIPIQMPVDEFNLHKSSGAQSFCSTSKMKYVNLPHVSESRASSGTTPRPNSRPVPLCSERYMVTPITQVTPIPKSKPTPQPRPKSEQQQRFEEGSKALARCRVLKRTSEILSHRMDRLYYMSGVSLNLGSKYATDEEALRRMQALAQEARMLTYKTNTPSDSLPKLDQTESESLQGQNEDPIGQTSGMAENCGGENSNSSVLNKSSPDSFFITQNGAVNHSDIHEANQSEVTQREVEKVEVDAEVSNPVMNGEVIEDLEDERIEATGTSKSAHRSPSAVRERRILLFGSSERPQRVASRLTKKSSLRVMTMYDNFKDKEASKDDESEDEVSIESSPEDEEDVLTSEDVSQKIRQYIQKGSKKLEHDRSIFKDRPKASEAEPEEGTGVKYTSKVHKEEEKKQEFRRVTKHLVVKQEGNILEIEPNMDEEQATMFSGIFSEIDRDNDGKVGIEDLQAQLFGHLKAIDIPHFLRVFDINKDQQIDRREFLAVAGLNDKLCKQRTTKVDGDWKVDLEKLSYYITVYREMFDAVDIDHDGHLSLEELMVIIAASLDEETGTDIELMEDILDSIDKEGTGTLDFVDYLQYIPTFLQIHNYLMRKPMLIEDLEKSRRIVRATLHKRNDSESSADNIWD